ncbi:MAG: ComF family protein [Gemmatimonadales bacterium]
MQPWRERWSDLTAGAAALERWLLPAECLLCHGAAGAADALICDLCRRRWRPVTSPWCARCGQPAVDDLPCRLCAEWPEALACTRSAVWLDEGARGAVHALKYSGWWRVTAQLAQAMSALEPLAKGVILVPVPLAPKRLATRGYNQAERLAAALGRLTGLEVVDAALARRRETPTQTALTPEGRRANMAGAFAGEGVRGRTVVLVDDVLTTGATLGACAEALRVAGAARVDAVTFARARAVGDFA